MINNLHVTSPHLTTSGAYSTPYIGNNGQTAGAVRWNTSGQQMEVFDGITWISINQNVTIGITDTAEQAIRWATKKMQEEIDLKHRMDRHPGLKDAYEKFQIMDILSRESDVKPA